MQNIFTLMLILAVGLFGCSEGGESTSEVKDAGMEQFADDQEFKDAHETPEEIGYQGKGEMIEFPAEGQAGLAYGIMTEEPSDKYLLVIHEWWGLNDHIKQEADRLFAELGDVNVLALDLYDGQATADRDEAGKIMNSREEDRLNAIIKGAIAFAGEEAEIGTIGWCFGGGWSLRASILAGEKSNACVMYYGMPVQDAKQLAPLEAPVLGIFAKKDGWINEEVIGNFENLAQATGKDLEVKWYDADHAFANPSSPRYNEAAAQEANQVALDYLREHL
jgi:carboxymethylenebutenolidase